MHPGPERLRDHVGVGQLRPEDLLVDALLDDGQDQSVGIRLRIGPLVHEHRIVAGQQRRHVHQTVVVRLFQAHLQERRADAAQAVERRLVFEAREEGFHRHRDVVLDERPDHLLLVLEVLVDRGRAVLDGIRHLPQRHRVVTLRREEIPGGIQDLSPHLFTLPRTSFRRAH